MAGNHFPVRAVPSDGAMVRTLIADYEPLARAHLHRLLGERGYEPAHCSDDKLLGLSIERVRPQLLFLDLDLITAESGLFHTSSIDPTAAVIVTSAHQGGMAPDELEPVDYLLKPFDRARFQKVLNRAEAFLGAGPSDSLRRQHLQLLNSFPESVSEGTRGSSAARGQYLHRVMVREGEEIAFIKAEEIDRIEVHDEAVEVHAHGQAYRASDDIDALARKLDPRQFLSIRRSQIVNLDRLSTMEVVHGAS